MRTYQLEGMVTALSSLIHSGGERNGTTQQLRREKFVQPDGSVEKVPIISGNSIRGILRDKGMFHMLRELGYGVNEETGEVTGLSLQAFHFLFSGGSLVSTGSGHVDVDHFRAMKSTIPLIGIFGGAAGNAIMPGKLKMGKLIPICAETKHLLPEEVQEGQIESIWEYCQTEMYTRRDDKKNDRLLPMLGEGEQNTTTAAPQQMMYHHETLSAGTRFYWKIVLEDVTDVEFEAFILTMIEFSKHPYVGGRSAIGHGEISVKLGKWIEIDSRVNLQGKELDVKLGTKYKEHLENNGDQIREFLSGIE